MSDPRLHGFECIPEMLRKFGEHVEWPRFTFELDPAHTLIMKLLRKGKHPGAASLEIKEGGLWLGYVTVAGEFQPTHNASRMPRPVKLLLWNLLQAIRLDPETAFAAHGIRTGTCCACGRTLTNAESVELGIGPICRERIFS